MMKKALIVAIFGHYAAAQEPVPGCIYYDFAYEGNRLDEGVNGVVQADSFTACQEICGQKSTCLFFSFSRGGCALHAGGATLKKDKHTISGPKTCEARPAVCDPVVSAGFPGDNATATNAAFSTGMQTPELQCWPKVTAGDKYTAVPTTCAKRVVVQDAAAGWEGKCLGLKEVTLADGESCEQKCLDDVTCPVWQWTNASQCWHGLGHDCKNRTGDGLEVVAAQRIVRGDYKVLKDLTGIQIMNMEHAFNADNFLTQEEGIMRCRNVCLSDIFCQYWQFHSEAGCYVESRTDRMPYPLTTATVEFDSVGASKMVAGEYIMHVCAEGSASAVATTLPPSATNAVTQEGVVPEVTTLPPAQGTTHEREVLLGSTTPAPEGGNMSSSGLPYSSGSGSSALSSGGSSSSALASSGSTSSIPWWLLIGLIVLGLLAALAAAMTMMGGSKKKKGKTEKKGSTKKRSSKVKKGAEEEQQLIPEPVVETPIATEIVQAPLAASTLVAPPVYLAPAAPPMRAVTVAPAVQTVAAPTYVAPAVQMAPVARTIAAPAAATTYVTAAAPTYVAAAPTYAAAAVPTYAEGSVFDTLDANHDGVISRSEFVAAMGR